MSKIAIFLSGILFIIMLSGQANAALTTIGTAQFGGTGTEYKLIWDDDNNGNSVVWLDYANDRTTYNGQMNWAESLDDDLTINLYDGYTVTWDDDAWRLATTVTGPPVYGYEGDPDNDGIYTYTTGYNLANSEMGHLFYEELCNKGLYDTDGNEQPDYGLENTGNFENLIDVSYWSGTEHYQNNLIAWRFSMADGRQGYAYKYENGYGLVLRTGQVSAVPIPRSALLIGAGLFGLAVVGRKKGRDV